MSDCISREAVKELLFKDREFIEIDDYGTVINADDVDNIPSVQPCGDAVSRTAVLDVMRTNWANWAEYDPDLALKLSIDEIQKMPATQPEREKGEWIKTPKAVTGEGFLWYCSKCQKEVYQDTSRNYPSENFCPRCGADMRGEDTATNKSCATCGQPRGDRGQCILFKAGECVDNHEKWKPATKEGDAE